MSQETLWAEAALGRDSQEFLASDIGRYIVGRCKQEKDDALMALALVSPWRRNRIRQLQNDVWRAESVPKWLFELVDAGQQAEVVLNAQDSD